MLDCEKDYALVVEIEEDSVVDFSASVPYFEPPYFALAGYVFDLWMVPGIGSIFFYEFFDSLGCRCLDLLIELFVVEAKLGFIGCLR